jgi:light-regulated signal transduction histidine kinase (bacteriophytochrome)
LFATGKGGGSNPPFQDCNATEPLVSRALPVSPWIRFQRLYTPYADGGSKNAGLLNSLLAYSRVTTKAEPRKKTDLKKSVEEALSNLEIMIKEKNARVEVGDLPTVAADRVQMIQLFQNLIGNALKYHRDGQEPRVRIYSRGR